MKNLAIRNMIIAGQKWQELYTIIENQLFAGNLPSVLFEKVEAFFRANPQLDSMHKAGFSSHISLCRDNFLIHCPQEEVSDKEFSNNEKVRIDFALAFKGHFVDAARSICLGQKPDLPMVVDGQQILDTGIDNAINGANLRDIVAGFNEAATKSGWIILPIFCGHGIGTSLHQKPKIAAYSNLCQDVPLRPGMTLALEFVASQKSTAIFQHPNSPAYLGDSQCQSIHFEDTIIITNDKPVILTRPLSISDRERLLGIIH